jgi:threonine dehydrogenase-like Zn-dependent dehydrogenase
VAEFAGATHFVNSAADDPVKAVRALTQGAGVDHAFKAVGAKVVSHGRYVTFQMAEVAVSRQMFNEILSLIARLRALPAPA